MLLFCNSLDKFALPSQPSSSEKQILLQNQGPSQPDLSPTRICSSGYWCTPGGMFTAFLLFINIMIDQTLVANISLCMCCKAIKVQKIFPFVVALIITTSKGYPPVLQLRDVYELPNLPSDDQFFCPHCINIVAHSIRFHKKHSWARTLHCPRCKGTWHICTECKTDQAFKDAKAIANHKYRTPWHKTVVVVMGKCQMTMITMFKAYPMKDLVHHLYRLLCSASSFPLGHLAGPRLRIILNTMPTLALLLAKVGLTRLFQKAKWAFS